VWKLDWPIVLIPSALRSASPCLTTRSLWGRYGWETRRPGPSAGTHDCIFQTPPVNSCCAEHNKNSQILTVYEGDLP
jgi:hypothetical protein